MRRTENGQQIAIVDESGSAPEKELAHGMPDLAAALVVPAWRATLAGVAFREVTDALDAIASRFAPSISDDFTTLVIAEEEALTYAARLGFALARTSGSADRGWAFWLAAAQDWLTAGGCAPGGHGDLVIQYLDRDIAELKERVRSAALAEAPEVGTVQEALTEHTRQHHAEPLTPVSSFDRTITGLSNAVQESLDEHVRLHHADRPVPTQEPSTPKARPTVEEQPKRQPAASRAATAPPARHRAVDAGHVAVAVPSFDQCAGDDLEIAGHRHPRATDPWFAVHGAG